MSATLTRLILAMVVILAAATLYVPVFVFIEEWILSSDNQALHVTNAVCAALLAAAWIAVWRGEVRWTPRRRWWTALTAVAAMAPAAGAFALENHFTGIVFGGMLWGVSWLALTAVVWREAKQERASRLRTMGIGTVACPTCGYNMAGLSEAHYPEGGSRFTLDQLIAAQMEGAAKLGGGD